MEGSGSGLWRAYHLYHHQDPEQVVRRFVTPVVRRLAGEGKIRRFFFLRFGLGGPHIRLRLEVRPGCAEVADRITAAAAGSFLERWPSLEPMEEEKLLHTHRVILDTDPNEDDERIYPDNTFRSATFHPETDRYGGPELLDPSLDVFCASSLEAVRFLHRQAGQPRSRQLVAGARVLLRQAWGLARNVELLAGLLNAAVRSWGEALPRVLERAEEQFERQPEALTRLVESELVLQAGLAEDADPDSVGRPADELLVRASRALMARVRSAEGAVRWRIAAGQLHTTALRLGFLNPEELYLSRLLTLAVAASREGRPELWERLEERLQGAGGGEVSTPALRGPRIAQALEGLGEGDEGTAPGDV